jgi:hypothetical protein
MFLVPCNLIYICNYNILRNIERRVSSIRADVPAILTEYDNPRQKARVQTVDLILHGGSESRVATLSTWVLGLDASLPRHSFYLDTEAGFVIGC